MGIGSLGNRLTNRAPQFPVVPSRDALPTVVDGSVFDRLYTHVRENTLVSGICAIDHDGVRFERRDAQVSIKAPSDKNDVLNVCVRVSSLVSLVFDIGNDGLVSRRMRIQKKHGERSTVGYVRREEALAILKDIARGLRVTSPTFDESAEDNAENLEVEGAM